MARSRNIKPGFFKNELLAEMPPETRLLFIGLWCLADREGRFEDRPKKIKMELFPCDSFDIEWSLSTLASGGFLVRYEADGKQYAQIVNWAKHQMPHHKEVASEIPAPDGFLQITKHTYDVSAKTREEVFSRDGHRCLKCGSPDSLSLDHIVPLASGGDNSMNNLQTLCKRCNSSKGNSTKDHRNGNNDTPSLQHQANDDSTLAQRQDNDGARCPSDSLIPDSLIPDLPITSAVDGEPTVSSSPNSALLGEACKAMRDAGMSNLNQSDPRLAEALAEGVTPQELADVALEKRGQGLAYVVATARGRRRDASAYPTGCGSRDSPRPRPMTVSEGRAIAAGTRLADFRAATAAEQQNRGIENERTIEAPAAPRRLG